jgi:parvulin-like peptidyl-prolyl isomerase
MDHGGDVGWIQKDNFAREKVEQAVWATQPGHITPIVEDTGGFYIAEVTATRDGHVQPFETQEVQDQITAIIEKDRRKQLMESVYNLLRKEYAVTANGDMMNTALEMAMQAYPRWSASAQ